jgi:hypothetical protein
VVGDGGKITEQVRTISTKPTDSLLPDEVPLDKHQLHNNVGAARCCMQCP